MDFSGLPDRLALIRETISAGQRAGGWTHPVEIVAVTKGHGPEAVRVAVAAGLTVVGENRVQEALAKQEAVGSLPVLWHLIGTLQRNKARQAVGRFALIHSVDRLDLAQEIGRRLTAPLRQSVLVQVNCSNELQKGGVEPAGLPELLEQVAGAPGVDVRGLMTMAAFDADAAAQHRAFGLLRRLRDEAMARGRCGPELSMGMSGDYRVAVEEGATMVRLGTLLFGERIP
ncbi:MAG: YggS family pyridoxal phosphate-dependent enzyme [Gemmatimonadota bacterium]